MLGPIIAALIILWLLGVISIPGLVIPNPTLFILFGQPITLFTLLTVILILVLIDLLPGPLRWIVGVIFIVWLLSILGILSIPGLSTLLIPAIIIGAILALLGAITD